MALTNIELYEALKRDLSEDSARMIAEVIPAASDLATKADVAGVDAHLMAVELRLERQIERRIAALERRFFVIFAVPLWGAVIAGLAKYLTS